MSMVEMKAKDKSEEPRSANFEERQQILPSKKHLFPGQVFH